MVRSSEKVGSDAGELAGIGPIGVRATGDAGTLLALSPDCVVYAASGPDRDVGAVPDYVRLLDAGVNVVSVSTPSLVYPPVYDPARTVQLTEAAEAGRTLFYSSGIEPGFAADELPLLLATQSRSITSIRSSEILLYHEYPVVFMMRDVMGFGMPMEYEPLLAMSGAQTQAWGHRCDWSELRWARRSKGSKSAMTGAPSIGPLPRPAGPIEAGTCGAVRAETIGVIDGLEAIVIEHVNRMTPDIAPEWPIGDVDGTYRIRIEGDPAINCDMSVGDPGSPTAGGMTVTAMRVVNAIPYVVAADPGLISSLDRPLTLPCSAFG